jgi:hypothetical protein
MAQARPYGKCFRRFSNRPSPPLVSSFRTHSSTITMLEPHLPMTGRALPAEAIRQVSAYFWHRAQERAMLPLDPTEVTMKAEQTCNEGLAP